MDSYVSKNAQEIYIKTILTLYLFVANRMTKKMYLLLFFVTFDKPINLGLFEFLIIETRTINVQNCHRYDYENKVHL